MTVADTQQRVHVTGLPGIMHGHDCLSLFGDCSFDQAFIKIEAVRTNIHEHRHRTTQHEGVGSGDERE
ncbi:hypothetical protein D3C76_1571770 [compost metagenome]